MYLVSDMAPTATTNKTGSIKIKQVLKAAKNQFKVSKLQSMQDPGYITSCDKDYHITKKQNEGPQYPDGCYIFCLNEHTEPREYDTKYMYITQLHVHIVVDIVNNYTFIMQISSCFRKK